MKNRESLYSRTQDVKEAMDIIAQRMLELRPRGQVCLRPYRIDPASGQKRPLGELEVDLKKDTLRRGAGIWPMWERCCIPCQRRTSP